MSGRYNADGRYTVNNHIENFATDLQIPSISGMIANMQAPVSGTLTDVAKPSNTQLVSGLGINIPLPSSIASGINIPLPPSIQPSQVCPPNKCVHLAQRARNVKSVHLVAIIVV